MNDNDYERALALFNEVSDYKDSAALINFYNCAVIDGRVLVDADNTKISGQVVIPGYIEVIGRRAFADCDNLTSVEIPDGVAISPSAFWGTPLEGVY